jgi:hypothetical protein
MLVVYGVVDEDPRLADGRPGLAGGDAASLIEIDAVEAGLVGHLQPLDERQRLSIGLAGDHAELAREKDSLPRWRLNERVDRHRVGGDGSSWKSGPRSDRQSRRRRGGKELAT